MVHFKIKKKTVCWPVFSLPSFPQRGRETHTSLAGSVTALLIPLQPISSPDDHQHHHQIEGDCQLLVLVAHQLQHQSAGKKTYTSQSDCISEGFRFSATRYSNSHRQTLCTAVHPLALYQHCYYKSYTGARCGPCVVSYWSSLYCCGHLQPLPGSTPSIECVPHSCT